MLWDESFRSWIELGVSAQPTAILLALDGTIITRWTGPSRRTRSSNTPPVQRR
jgi:hypothetical protein